MWAFPPRVRPGGRDRLPPDKRVGALAPFPARHESEYDTFGVGHSSTSISAALGMAVAAARAGEDRRAGAGIGAGALSARAVVQGADPGRPAAPRPPGLLAAHGTSASRERGRP